MTSVLDRESATANDELAAIVTPTVRRAVRRSLYWVIAVVGLIALGLVVSALNGAGSVPQTWGANETAPVGSRAVVEVLRDQGVEVEAVDRLDAALDAVDEHGGTLLVADELAVLTEDQWQRLGGVAEHLVLVQPETWALDALELDALQAEPFDEAGGPVELSADCRVAEARRAADIIGSGIGYTTLDGESCFDGGTAGFALLRLTGDAAGETGADGGIVSVLGTGSVLQNGSITQAGNAALALGLLGQHDHVTWYLPGFGDLSAPSIAELTPSWVNPVAWLALTVGLVAAFWRGRRLGPVVVERLPVVVRTTETMEGRARLYASGAARLRAIDAVRVGTLRRLADGLALGRAAGVDDIIASVAAITHRPVVALRALLVDDEPRDDRALVRLSDDLLELEREVARRVSLEQVDGGHAETEHP